MAHPGYDRKWRKENPDRVRGYKSRYRKQHPEARERDNRAHREWRKKNPEKAKHRDLKKAYGMSLTVWKELLKKQSGYCAICSVHLSCPYVDHDHKTKKIRELLCKRCNNILGFAKDDIEILRAAIAYLDKHQNQNSIKT